MSKEFRLSPPVEKRRKHLSALVLQRESLVERIGTGKITEGSSWEDALRVGSVKRQVKASVGRFNEELDSMAKTFAKEYLDLFSLREKQLVEMRKMVGEANLSPETVEHFSKEFESLAKLPEKNAFLKRGLGRTKQEENPGTSVHKLDLQTRWRNALARSNITIERLENMSDGEILKVKLIGDSGLWQIKRAIESYRAEHSTEVSNPRK